MISEPLLHKMKILVVDDDRMTVTLLEQLLQRHGYCRVLGITDSRNALDTCTNFDPDLILLDLMMPEVDGFAVLEALLRIRNLLETRRLHLVLENQRAALEEAVRERTTELRGTIAELQAVNQH